MEVDEDQNTWSVACYIHVVSEEGEYAKWKPVDRQIHDASMFVHRGSKFEEPHETITRAVQFFMPPGHLEKYYLEKPRQYILSQKNKAFKKPSTLHSLPI